MLSIRPLISDDHCEIVDIWHRGWHDAHAGLVPKGVLNYRTIDYFWSWLHCSTDQFQQLMVKYSGLFRCKVQKS